MLKWGGERGEETRENEVYCLNLKREIEKNTNMSIPSFHNLKRLPWELISLVMKGFYLKFNINSLGFFSFCYS